MFSTYSDTIAREQQIREFTHPTKPSPSTSKVRARQDKPYPIETVLLTLLHIILTVFFIGYVTINNGPLLREAYFALLDTANETVIETPGLFRTK